MESKTVIRVVLVDDHPVVREGLRSTLPACGPVQIVGEAENGLQAIKIVGETRPNVVLMDVKMPVMNFQFFLLDRVQVYLVHHHQAYLL